MRAVSIISDKSIDVIAQCLYYDKSTKQHSVQLKSLSINVTLGSAAAISVGDWGDECRRREDRGAEEV